MIIVVWWVFLRCPLVHPPPYWMKNNPTILLYFVKAPPPTSTTFSTICWLHSWGVWRVGDPRSIHLSHARQLGNAASAQWAAKANKIQTLWKQSAVMSQLSGEINTSTHPQKERTAQQAAKQSRMLSFSFCNVPYRASALLSPLYLTSSHSHLDHRIQPLQLPLLHFFFVFASMAGMWLDSQNVPEWELSRWERKRFPQLVVELQQMGVGRARQWGVQTVLFSVTLTCGKNVI